jgi:hypothetical protein
LTIDRSRPILVAPATLVTHAQSQSNAHTGQPALISTQTVGLAIDGYDAVAYIYTPMSRSLRETAAEVVFLLIKGKPREIRIG